MIFDRPEFSVIIPSYNREKDIARCLQSLCDQTYKNFEVIVCDDGSTDNTAAVVNGFAQKLPLSYLRLPNFGGPARPRNEGVKHAKGELLCFLDSDDWWHPEKLARCKMLTDQGWDFVYHDLEIRTEEFASKRPRKVHAQPLAKPIFENLIVKGNVIPNSSVVVRKKWLEKINGFSEDRNFIACEDYDAWLKIARNTDSFIYLPKVLGYYWAGGGNISSNERKYLTLKELCNKYEAEIQRIDAAHPAYFLEYRLALAAFHSNRKKEAAKIFGRLLGRKLPLKVRIIAILLLISATIYR